MTTRTEELPALGLGPKKKKKIRRNDEAAAIGVVNVSQMARRLGTGPSSLHYHIRAGHIPRPMFLLGGFKCWTASEVEEVERFWRTRVPLGCSKFTAADVAVMRSMYEGGLRQVEIASHFNTTQTLVSFLLTGRVQPGWRGGRTGLGDTPKEKTYRLRRRNMKKVSDDAQTDDAQAVTGR